MESAEERPNLIFEDSAKLNKQSEDALRKKALENLKERRMRLKSSSIFNAAVKKTAD